MKLTNNDGTLNYPTGASVQGQECTAPCALINKEQGSVVPLGKSRDCGLTGNWTAPIEAPRSVHCAPRRHKPVRAMRSRTGGEQIATSVANQWADCVEIWGSLKSLGREGAGWELSIL